MRRLPAESNTSPCVEVDSGRPDVPAFDRGFRERDAAPVGNRVLLDHDRIGAVGNDAAGEDPHGFTCADSPLEWPAGGDLADDREPGPRLRGVGSAHGIAVHRRHRLRRLGASRRDIARKDAMERLIQRDHFLRERPGAGEDRGEGVGNRHQGHELSFGERVAAERKLPSNRSCAPWPTPPAAPLHQPQLGACRLAVDSARVGPCAHQSGLVRHSWCPLVR